VQGGRWGTPEGGLHNVTGRAPTANQAAPDPRLRLPLLSSSSPTGASTP